jgi:hypothetical protein
MTINLQIGGYAIRLYEREGYPFRYWPLPPFDSFLVKPERSPVIDFDVRIVRDLPEIPHHAPLFDAGHGLWRLYAAESGYMLESPDTNTLEPRSRAIVSEDFSRVTVWHWEERSSEGRGWTPMHVITPLMEVCLVTRLAREGGLMLHASGVVTEQGGWAFTGPSGAGKSTLADLFARHGAPVLSDERIIIRNVNDRLMVYGTPWQGSGRQAANAAASLTALYCIRHGNGAHVLRYISPRDFSLFVLRQCFLPHWDRTAMDRTLAFLDELIVRLGCKELAFAKQPDIVDYLIERHLEHQTAVS